MSLKQQYQRFLLSKAFFQSQQELKSDSVLLLEEEYDFSEQDNIRTQWVSYYYIPLLDRSEELKLRRTLIRYPGVMYIRLDYATRHLAIYHDGDVAPLSLRLNRELETIIYQQTLSNFVPSAFTLQPVIRTTQNLSWLSSIHAILTLVAGLFAWLASSWSLGVFAVLMLMDAFVYLLASYVLDLSAAVKRRLLRAMSWLLLLLSLFSVYGVLWQSFHFKTDHVIAVFIVIQGILGLIGAVASRYLIAKDYVKNRPLHWGHLIKNFDVIAAAGLVLTGLLIEMKGWVVMDLIMAFWLLGLLWVRLFGWWVLNRFSAKT